MRRWLPIQNNYKTNTLQTNKNRAKADQWLRYSHYQSAQDQFWPEAVSDATDDQQTPNLGLQVKVHSFNHSQSRGLVLKYTCQQMEITFLSSAESWPWQSTEISTLILKSMHHMISVPHIITNCIATLTTKKLTNYKAFSRYIISNKKRDTSSHLKYIKTS